MCETKISVLIPVYNVENYLRECLDSITVQTFQDFEVICVDDGSDDKSFEILQEYKNKDKRFTVIKQDHKGVGPARNLALSLAKSKYIQFLDSDDFIEPAMFEEMYNAAVKYDTDMVVCTAIKRTPEGEFIERGDLHPVNKSLAIFDKPFCWKDCPETIFSMFAPESWQVLYKKELLDKNNLRFPDLSSSNGAALGYIARICASRIVILDKAFINYRCYRPNSITSSSNSINGIRQYVELKNYLLKHGLYADLELTYKQSFKDWLKLKCIQRKMFGNQFDEFVKAFKELMKDDWKDYEDIIYHKEFAYRHIYDLAKDKKIVFWGASLFLEDFVERYQLNHDNILGIIDKNPEKWGEYIGKYRIYAPKDLAKLNPDVVIITIVHYVEERSAEINEYIKNNITKSIKVETI